MFFQQLKMTMKRMVFTGARDKWLLVFLSDKVFSCSCISKIFKTVIIIASPCIVKLPKSNIHQGLPENSKDLRYRVLRATVLGLTRFRPVNAVLPVRAIARQ